MTTTMPAHLWRPVQAGDRTPFAVCIVCRARELNELAEELIVGHLQGKPVLCASCAETAVTVVFPSAPACAEHAQ